LQAHIVLPANLAMLSQRHPNQFKKIANKYHSYPKFIKIAADINLSNK
jgi:hypothetical protein